MRIDPNSVFPIYEQIILRIRAAVAAGVYRPGEMLPSQRALALKLHVNPNTVRRAYEQLERDGDVVCRQGLGIFVTKRAAARAHATASEVVRNAFLHTIRTVAGDLEPETIEKAFHDAVAASAAEIEDAP